MKMFVPVLLPAVAGLLLPSAWADKPRASVKSGGPFEVTVTRKPRQIRNIWEKERDR